MILGVHYFLQTKIKLLYELFFLKELHYKQGITFGAYCNRILTSHLKNHKATFTALLMRPLGHYLQHIIEGVPKSVLKSTYSKKKKL